jgi:hypothetical protein
MRAGTLHVLFPLFASGPGCRWTCTPTPEVERNHCHLYGVCLTLLLITLLQIETRSLGPHLLVA